MSLTGDWNPIGWAPDDVSVMLKSAVNSRPVVGFAVRGVPSAAVAAK